MSLDSTEFVGIKSECTGKTIVEKLEYSENYAESQGVSEDHEYLENIQEEIDPKNTSFAETRPQNVKSSFDCGIM